MNGLAKNTDKEIWRRVPGDVYTPSIHVTSRGDIGIQVGGKVIILPVEAWFTAATKYHEGLNIERRTRGKMPKRIQYVADDK